MMSDLFLLIIILSTFYITYLIIESLLILLLKYFVNKKNKSYVRRKATLKSNTQLEILSID